MLTGAVTVELTFVAAPPIDDGPEPPAGVLADELAVVLVVELVAVLVIEPAAVLVEPAAGLADLVPEPATAPPAPPEPLGGEEDAGVEAAEAAVLAPLALPVGS